MEKVSDFFKILNRKIEQYDTMTSNPFEKPLPVVLIWVEKDCEDKPEN